jgi:hypothetical protein
MSLLPQLVFPGVADTVMVMVTFILKDFLTRQDLWPVL